MELITFETMLPQAGQWDLLLKQSHALLQSGLLPQSLKKPEQVIVVILKGRELNIPPMQALEHIHVINGKPSISAELMLAQILKLHPRTKIKYVELTNTRCAMEVTRDGMEASTFSFSIEDATTAGLLKNPSWQKYPRAMCRSRCISEMARSLFPDALAGVSYTPEELGAEVDDAGAIINVEAKPVAKIETVEIKTPLNLVDILEQLRKLDVSDEKIVSARGKPISEFDELDIKWLNDQMIRKKNSIIDSVKNNFNAKG